MELYPTALNPAPEGARCIEIRARGGYRLRAMFATVESPRGTVVILGGRSDYMERYFETMRELNARGYAVASFDFRGQGGSHRILPNHRRSHIRDFRRYDEDFQAFMTQVVLAEGPGPFYAIGHSTGGNILIRSLSKHKWFAKAVAVPPLLGLHYPGWPLAAVRMVLFLALSAGLGRARLPGYPDRSMSREDFPDNPLTSDQRRFNRDIATLDAAPHLGLGAPSFAWLKAARRSMARLAVLNPKKNLTCPLLMVGAGLDRVVDNEATRRFAGRMPGVSLVTIHEAEHEILNERDEIREQFFAIFDTYIGGSDIA